MQSSFLKNAVILGLISAIGPFAIDMYLPALPTIATDLNASTAATQMTLMAFFVTFGVCQLIYGPAADMWGRKPPLYFGLAVFTLGAIGCAVSPSIGWLIFFRGLQGIGGSAVMVVPRAIIRDMHTGVEGTRLMALVMLVLSVSPILAPITGSALIVPFGWRAVFVAITIVAIVGLVLLATLQAETLKPQNRIKISVRNLAAGFGGLFRDARFLGLTFVGGFGFAAFFAFLASASFVYIGHFGLTPTVFSVFFSINAVGFIGASQFAASLGQRFGMNRLMAVSVAGFTAMMLVLLALTLAGVDNFAVLVALLLIGFAFMGFVIPSTMVLALDEQGERAGMASALGGTLQMILGGITIVIASRYFDGTVLPMVTIMAVCAVASLALTVLTVRRAPPMAVEATDAAQPAE